MISRPNVTVYTDGAGSSSGVRAYFGGYAAILISGGAEKIVRGHQYPATNGAMEIMALIAGLRTLKRPCQVEFYSDAQYLVKGVNIWLPLWKERNWRAADGKALENLELWRKIDRLVAIHNTVGHWVRGHVPIEDRNSHHEYNARCDEMAVAEAWIGFREHASVQEKEQ